MITIDKLREFFIQQAGSGLKGVIDTRGSDTEVIFAGVIDLIELQRALVEDQMSGSGGKWLYCTDPATGASCSVQISTESEAFPDNCDGKEQLAFEAWAKDRGYDMREHPLHYLFMDSKTDAARMGWSAAIRYCRSVLKSGA